MKKRILALILTIAMLFTLTAALSVSATGEEIGLTLNNNNLHIGDIVTASFYVKNFDSLANIDVALGWNPAVLAPWHKSLDRPAMSASEFINDNIYEYILMVDGFEQPAFEKGPVYFNKTSGLVDVGYSVVMQVPFVPYTFPDPSQKYIFFKLRFKVLSEGDAGLRIAKASDAPLPYVADNANGYIIQKEFGVPTVNVIENVSTFTVGNIVPEFSAAASAVPGATALTVTNGEGGMTYSYAFSGTNVVPESGWSAYTSSLAAIAVPKGGNNRYLFLKSKTSGGDISDASDGYDLTGKVSVPNGPPATSNRPGDSANNPLNIKFSWTANTNATLGIPFAIEVGLTPLDAYQDQQHYDYCKGTFDVGYTTAAVPFDATFGVVDQNCSLPISWFTGDDYEGVTTSGYFGDTPINDIGSDGVYGRLPLYLAWNARCPVLRYSADGVIPASKPTYYSNDLYDANIPADRYSIFPGIFGKYELEPIYTCYMTANIFMFTQQSTFMKWMRYVVFVDRDLSTDTTWYSESKYAFKPVTETEITCTNASKANKGQLFRDYAITKITADNVFYTDENGKPWKDQAFTQPFTIALYTMQDEYVYIAPVNVQVGHGGNPCSVEGGNANNFGIYYCSKDTSPYSDTDVAFGGTGEGSTFTTGTWNEDPLLNTLVEYTIPPQNIVQRYPVDYPPPPPPNVSGGAGKILDTTTEMEYSTDGENYTQCSDIETVVSPGTYYVRYAAKPGFSASADTQVTVTCGPNYVYGYVDSIPSGYRAGFTVTLFGTGISATTDANGYFSIANVQPGTYNMVISRLGAMKRTIAITVDNFDFEVSTSAHKIGIYLGDVNNDGRINAIDLGAVKGAYSTTPTNLHWISACDFNQDGRVNSIDLGIIKANYGKNGASNYIVWVK